MPTYCYACGVCGHEDERLQSIRAYTTEPDVPHCPGHGPMERKLTINPSFSGLANALAGDRHYDGLRATDGSDISSRSKHREYLKRTGLTCTSDFTEAWKKQAQERANRRSGEYQDKELRTELAKEVYTAINKGST